MVWLDGLKPVGAVGYSRQLSEIGMATVKNLGNKHTKTSKQQEPKISDFEESKLSSSASTIRLDESPCLPDSNFSSYNSTDFNGSSADNPTPLKELSVDFLGRDDLLITCVREFLEILVMSLVQ